MIEEQAPDLVAICTKGDNHAEFAEAVSGVRMRCLKQAIACSMNTLSYLVAIPGYLSSRVSVPRVGRDIYVWRL